MFTDINKERVLLKTCHVVMLCRVSSCRHNVLYKLTLHCSVSMSEVHTAVLTGHASLLAFHRDMFACTPRYLSTATVADLSGI